MNKYIALLRGINVGGHKPLKMDSLKSLFLDLGFTNILTYIQSGNIVFEAKHDNKDSIEQLIEKEILKKFNFEVPVMILTTSELNEVISNNSFLPNNEESFLHVTILKDHPKESIKELFKETVNSTNEISFIKKTIYLNCINGYSNTKFTNSYIENKLKVKASTRNWKTIKAIYNIACSTLVK